VVTLPVAFVAGLIMQQVGFFFAFFLAAAVGGLIAEVVCRATGGKRGRPLAGLVCACIVVGALASAALTMLTVPGASLAAVLSAHNLLALLFRLNVVYVVLAIGAAYARLM
jgi:fucose 4-O-acetylase-like acetyltransferase